MGAAQHDLYSIPVFPSIAVRFYRLLPRIAHIAHENE